MQNFSSKDQILWNRGHPLKAQVSQISQNWIGRYSALRHAIVIIQNNSPDLSLYFKLVISEVPQREVFSPKMLSAIWSILGHFWPFFGHLGVKMTSDRNETYFIGFLMKFCTRWHKNQKTEKNQEMQFLFHFTTVLVR